MPTTPDLNPDKSYKQYETQTLDARPGGLVRLHRRRPRRMADCILPNFWRSRPMGRKSMFLQHGSSYCRPLRHLPTDAAKTDAATGIVGARRTESAQT